MNEQEIWKPVVGYELKYEVSNTGKIRSYHRKCIFIRKENTTKQGYKTITLSQNNKRKTFFIHGIVASAFIGKKKEGFVIDHIDNIKINNSAENLRYISFRENCLKDRKKSNTLPWGVRLFGKYFMAYRSFGGIQYVVGRFNTAEEAKYAYDNCDEQKLVKEKKYRIDSFIKKHGIRRARLVFKRYLKNI